MRRRLTLAGLMEITGRLLLFIVVITIADRLLHLEAGTRKFLLLASAAAAVYWLIKGIILKLVRQKWDTQNIALYLEPRISDVKDKLAAALDFAGRLPVAEPGSKSRFMERVVKDVDNTTHTTDFRRALPRRRLGKAFGFLFIAALIFGGALFVDSHAGFLGVKRALMPWRSHQWPTLNKLAVIIEGAKEVADYNYIAPIGSKLKVRVSARGIPPEKIIVSVKSAGDRRLTYSADLGQSQACTVELPELTTDAVIRVVGGDFKGRPIYIRAVRRPEIARLESRLKFPAYTGKEDDKRSGIHLAGQMRTEAFLTVHFAEPVARCILVGDTEEVSLEKTNDKAYLIKLTITRKRSFGLNAFTPEGIELARQLKIPVQLRADRLPKFSNLLPGRNIRMTRGATVPITFRATDDFGIRQIALAYNKSKQEPIQQILFKSPDSLKGPTRFENSYEWSLARMDLAPGDRIDFRLEADDFSHANEGKFGRSRKYHIDIISDRQSLDNALATFYEMLTRLEAIRNYQKSTEDIARLAIDRQGSTKELKTIDRRTRQTGSDIETVEREIIRLKAQLTLNKLLATPEYKLFDTTAAKLQALLAGPVSKALEYSAGTAKTPSDTNLRKLLAEAEADIVRGLDDILKKLTRSQSMSDVAQRLSEIASDQIRLAQATEELLKKSLEENLNAADRQGAENLAGQQKSLQSKTEGALSQLDELAGEFFGVDNNAYNTATSTKNLLEREGVRGLMRDAAEKLSSQLFGRAMESQSRAASHLNAAAGQLASPNGAPPQMQANGKYEKLELPEQADFIPFQYSLQASLLEVRDKQTILNNKTEKLVSAPEGRPRTIKIQRLSSEQEDIAIKTGEIITNLQDQPAAVFTAILKQVARDMHDSGEFLRQGFANKKVRALQRATLRILDQLLASMMTESRKIARPSKADEGDSGEGQEDAPPEPGELKLLNPINELKMLKLVQLNVVADTEKAERLEAEGKAEDARKLRVLIAQRQDEITTMLQEMINLDFGLYSRDGGDQ